MHFLDDSLLPENQQKLVIQVAPYGPAMGRRRLRRHPRHDGPAGPKGGRLLERRRHRAARARARRRRQGQQAPVQVQRDAGAPARSGAADDPAGRRLDLLRPRERWPGRQVDERRHAPHAGRARPAARPGHGGDQHPADERDGADDRGRRGRHLAGQPGGAGRLPRHDRAVQSVVARGAHPPPGGQRHPAALHAGQPDRPRKPVCAWCAAASTAAR